MCFVRLYNSNDSLRKAHRIVSKGKVVSPAEETGHLKCCGIKSKRAVDASGACENASRENIYYLTNSFSTPRGFLPHLIN